MGKPALERYDLETLRLGYYSALRKTFDCRGRHEGYAVIGQPASWPRREASVRKLEEMGFLEIVAEEEGWPEARMRLTERGENLYAQFLDALERGAL